MWQQAARDALVALQAAAGSNHAAVALLTGHLTLYNAPRNEFYSAIDPSLFNRAGLRIQQVVILIDDIFDMYFRLREQDEVMDEEVGIDHYLERNWQVLGRTGRPEFDVDDVDLLRNEYRVRQLLFLLAWRRAELVQAELLARQLHCRFVPLGVKHPQEVVLPLFDRHTPPPPLVYVSHPISRPRRFRREHGDWPPFVGQCNAIPRALARLQVLPVMPTAIDELRLQQPRDDLLDRWPILEARWPRPVTEIGLLITPQAAALDQIFDADAFNTATDSRKHTMVGLIRGLEAAIQAEVPFRDHLLISATQHLVIFRPLYETGVFSDGVQDEIKHWSDLRSAGEDRRAALIHDVTDVELAMIAASEGRRREYTTTQVMGLALRLMEREVGSLKGSNASREQCRRLLYGELPTSLLDEMPLGSTRLAALQRSVLEDATALFLYGHLTTSDVSAEEFGVFYITANRGFDRELAEHVVAFLRASVPRPDPQIPREIPEQRDLAKWAAELLGIDLLS